MTTKEFDKLGNECIDHLTALNPKGGIKVFVRMAVEFGYKRAVKNLTIPRVSQRSELVCLEKRNGWPCIHFFPSDICKSCEYCKSKQTCG